MKHSPWLLVGSRTEERESTEDNVGSLWHSTLCVTLAGIQFSTFLIVVVWKFVHQTNTEVCLRKNSLLDSPAE